MKAVRVTIAILLSTGIVGCGTARRGEPLANELVPSSSTLMQGERVFYQHCHQCHTGGEASLGPAINNKPLPAWLMRVQVRHGLGAMPAFSENEIDDTELDNLTQYLIALRRHPSR